MKHHLSNRTLGKYFNTNSYIRLALIIFYAGFFVLGLGVKGAEAATYYVSPSGTDDVNHGTGIGINAWKTLDYALTGNRVSRGDVIKIETGTYIGNAADGLGNPIYNGANTRIIAATNTPGTGPVIIEPLSGEVILELTNTTTGGIFYPDNSRQYLFRNIKFRNSVNSSKSFIIDQNSNSVTLEDCDLDSGLGTASHIATAGTGKSIDLIIKRTKFKSQNVAVTIIKENTATPGVININVESSLFNGGGSSIDTEHAVNITTVNSTFYDTEAVHIDDAAYFEFRNNIVARKAGITNGIWLNNNASAYLLNNPSSYKVSNNIFWREGGPDGNIFRLFDTGVNLLPIDHSNKFIDPEFGDASLGDFTIKSTSKISGLGYHGSIPSQSITGTAFTGDDVGCYLNPSTDKYVITPVNKVAFLGDSIMAGGNASAGNEGWKKFHDNTGIDTYDARNEPTSISGANLGSISFLADYVAYIKKPKLIFISAGVNNLLTLASNSPTNLTNDQLANNIILLMQKIESYGITPIWLGVESLSDNQIESDSVNHLVETACQSHDWKCGSILDQMRLDTNWQIDYYENLIIDVHPNNAGHAVIANLAEYLYFNHKIIGIDNIDISAGARIYADGKFRDLGIANASTANLSVTPVGGEGSFNVNDKSLWMDITNLTWTNTGNHHKAWTESSSTLGSTNTLHAIGDLEVNKNYNIQIDSNPAISNITGTNCSNIVGTEVCKADSNGKITFTYTGGYSTHTFDITEGDNIPPTITIDPYTTQTTNQDITVTASTNEGTLNTTSHTFTQNGSFDFIATDQAGNQTTQTVTITNIDKTPQIETPTETPGEIKIPAPKLFSNDTRKSFSSTLKSSKVKLKHTTPEIANGKVQIKKGDKLIKEVSVDENGNWSTTFNSKTFKLHYLNQQGTEVATSKEYKLKVDNEKPKIKTLAPLYIKHRGSIIDWEASDNKGIDYYTITFGNKKYKVKKSQIKIPSSVKKGAQTFTITAYDEVGNKTSKKGNLVVSW